VVTGTTRRGDAEKEGEAAEGGEEVNLAWQTRLVRGAKLGSPYHGKKLGKKRFSIKGGKWADDAGGQGETKKGRAM